MREAIKRIVLRMFPELAGGYHLDRYAKIIKISDPPTAGTKCDRFRPYFAADIQIITPEGEPVEDYPIFESVPLPVPSAGNGAGFYLWPRVGSIVTVRWIEGRPDHPVVQNVYPMSLSMPDVPDTSGRWQHRDSVYQYVDPSGNWERKTDKDIKDISKNLSEVIENLKSLQANTLTENISGNKTETIKGKSEETITGVKNITASAFNVSAPGISIASPTGTSLLPTISSAFQAIQDALNILAMHTHPNVGTCSEGGSISAKADSVGSDKIGIDSLKS